MAHGGKLLRRPTHPYREPPPAPPIDPPRSSLGVTVFIGLVTWLVMLVAHGSVLVLLFALTLLVPVLARPLPR